ncbi:MAG TPA: DNA gyrase subunit A [Bryobacteraceae bacterium]|nr:DNA gyrase subunit A [Bryobacteraceae bacterium]
MSDPQNPNPPVPPNGGGNQLSLGGDGGNRNVIPVNIEDEMRHSYLNYSMSVIIGRALPDVRDGLKPVHRRILFGMHELGLSFNRSTRKCAKITGDVMGKYHPHGNAPIYDALVRMAQPFNMRYPLVDGQGNFGSVDGDPPAAERYTEARLSRIAASLLQDIDQDTVDFSPNYDGSEQEPDVLPTRLPNLLINGSAGIAVGMATNVPPHNIREVLSAAIALVQHPETPLSEIIKMVPGPDFPTGGYILGHTGIHEYFSRGRGSLKLRAKVATEDIGRDRESLIVTELPYQVNKARLIEHIAALVNEKKIEGISEIRDESDREGMRIVMELKRGEQPEVILNNLYKHTQLQVNFGVIMLAIVNGQPRELGLLDCLKHFIDHRIDVVRRRTNFLLRKARDREHLLVGFQRALRNIDAVIQMIRESRNPKEARDRLVEFITPAEVEEYARLVDADPRGPRFTERQAQAIIELQLQRLTGMEQQKILDELADIQRQIAEYVEILGSEKVLRALIVKELKEVQKDFGDDRRTQIIEDSGDINLEDLVQQEDVAVTVTRGGYLKRTPIDTYQRQTRGGKGRIGMGTRAEDTVEHLLVANTHSYLLVFTNKGRVYWLKIYEIPDAGTAGKGKNINGLVNLQPDENVAAFLAVKEFVPDKYIVMVTRQGVIKKCDLTEFDNPMSRGIIAISLDDGDELLAARLTRINDYVFLGSHEGMAVRFREDEVRAMGRPARGVRAMNLAEKDFIVGVQIVGEDDLILSISENGFGKRTAVTEYRETARGAKGVTLMKTTPRIGKVMNVLSVKEDTDVVIITQNGKIIRIDSSNVRQAGRSTQGVKLVTLDEGDRVAAASVIPESEPKPENGNGNGNGGNGDQGNLPLQ